MSRLWVAAAAIVLSACAARSFEVIEPPLRDATLYPVSDTRDSVTVAVDEILDADRARRYFGADLPGVGIIPVNITVTNRGRERYRLQPSGILLRAGTQVIDPLRVEAVAQTIASHAESLEDDARQQLERYLSDIAFHVTTLEPYSSYQGVLFFPAPETAESGLFSVHTLFDGGRLRLQMLITGRDSRQTLHFGPLPLQGPPRSDDESWW